MKKLVSFLVIIIAAVTFVQTVNAQNPVNFNLSMTVDKYIETMQSPVSLNFGTTSHTGLLGGYEYLYGSTGEWDLAYANCGFSVTVAGNNPAGENKPRFARQEVGAHAGGFDVLATGYFINFTTNGDRKPLSGWGIIPLAAKQFPYTKNFNEAPHNGQVKMDMKAYVNELAVSLLDAVPLRRTIINPALTNEQSADAGDYTCTMIVTLAAL